ncbi:SDR family NAD(P)-dependent oxidoreductase [Micromonospora sp. WMMD718]|uniref:SDR family NAD(P)-dependent oxidoreductase n=3 Tax=unclassified Micromonospora TaxID=2617518 RepID=UPI00241794B2|nr:SDR family NAD(P)-dependent oxidoreductase [Micromonospora sp. WMMD718]MDG4752671.1 SDR family NAD(P)-dependent oxidoreductase [Micromonospora sp. WMMD718]
MNPALSRQEILARVRDGAMSVAQATAALGGAVTAGAHRSLSRLSLFEPDWQPGAEVAVRAKEAGRDLVTVLDGDFPSGTADSTAPGTVVTTTPGTGYRTDTADGHLVGKADDRGWEDLWDELDRRGRTARTVVVVTAADPEHSLDVAYPLVRTLIRRRASSPPAVVFATVGQHSADVAAALGAFGQIASLEDRRLRLLSVSLPPAEASTLPEIVRRAISELSLASPGLGEIRYRDGRRSVRRLRPVGWPADAPALPPGGVYLLSGGAGGIGRQLAERLARDTGARMVLLGRSAPSAATDELCDRIGQLGGSARYVRADVTRHADVAAAADLARATFGDLTGVLHLAGVNEDTYVVNKAAGAHRRVLTPKIAGVRHLDDVTRHDPLAMFVVFSSVAAYLGAPGQADYAAAGRALGGFAETRQAQVRAGLRSGRTVSIGWPLWVDGGMTLSERDRLATEALQGITAMPADDGWAALRAALALDGPEVLVAHGDTDRIRRYVDTRAGDTESGGEDVTDPDGTAAVERFLVGIVSDVTRIPPDRLDADQEFSAIGVDSVLIRRLAVVLEEKMGPLPATLFFEYRTVRELARHLAEAFPAPLRSAVAAFTASATPTTANPVPAAVAPSPARATSTRPAHTASATPGSEGIAIIGVAGRYPGARDLDEFWTMLRDGRDAITEVPADRWDHHRYFGVDRRPGTSYGRWGGFIDDVRRFDSLFFAIAPREAQRMDPAERLFLEVAWSAIEDGGYTPQRLQRAAAAGGGHAIGVYVGTTGLGYQLIGADQWGRGNPVSAHSMDFSLANRLSYLLDAHGPSMVIDTACSASLTALHVACEGLRHGDCRVAVAGGAYLNLHPSKFAMLAEQRMISRDGKLRAFGADADGFVPGEGIGAVLLKPLADAIADGDHVYAVILGTAVNHGGRTNGYTVPSPRAQAEVVSAALGRAGVEPATVSYVEAHGTGTELGDPIEFDGLCRVFADPGGRRQYCVLGSVKPSIGHAEAAAGIAGLTKVLLQLRHRELVPTLHSDPPNPRIDLAASPFRLPRHREAWQPLGPGVPRRAAVSSFGAGGANAHVVVEEYLADPPPGNGGDRAEELVVLSANTRDRLAAVVDRLAARLGDPALTGRLGDIAYTLQVGRQALAHRLAVRASSVAELRDRLRRWYGDEQPEQVRYGHVPDGKTARLEPAEADEVLSSRRWDTLAAWWVGGASVDWQRVPRSRPPRSVPLPAYPFEGPEHWPVVVDAPSSHAGPVLPAHLVPVPGEADGSLFEVRLDRRSPVVADHLIAGRPLLAGVAQLALALSAAGHHAGAPVTVVDDVRWRVPLDVDGRSCAVRVRPVGGRLSAEVRSGTGADTVVHSTFTMRTDPQPDGASCDLDAVRSRCPRQTDAETLYRQAVAHHMEYGPRYRRVRTLYGGDGEALAALDQPSAGERDDTDEGWPLDPGVLDAALHTVHGALPEDAHDLTVPAAAARIDVYGPSSAIRWAHARRTGLDPERGVATFDVLMCDGQGRGVLAVTGLRVLRRPAPVPYHRPAWQIRPAGPVRRATSEPVLVLSTRHDYGLGAALAAAYPGARRIGLDDGFDPGGISGPATIYFLGGVDDRWYDPADPDHLVRSCRTGPHALLAVARALAASRQRDIRLVVVTSDAQQTDPATAVGNPLAAALHGLARTISRELPFVETVCVDLDRLDLELGAAGGDWIAVRYRLAAEPATQPMTEVAWRGGVRLEKTLVRAVPPAPSEALPGLRQQGRYLLIGGCGGLGQTIATQLAGYRARLTIVGRRREPDLPPGQLESLRAAGAQVRYLQADVTRVDEMRAVVAAMHAEHGGIDGVIHTAFVLADRTLAQMDTATFDAAYAPKALGTAALCAALAAENLDFVALFSSAIAHTGNPGQANYAAGSTVQDALGLYFAARHHLPVQVIDWGYWGEHGAVAGEDYRERMSRAGVGSLSDAEGVQVFETIVRGGADHVVPVRAAALAAATPVNDGVRHEGLPPGPSALRAIRHALTEHLDRTPEPFPPDYLGVLDAYSRLRMYRSLRDAGTLPGDGVLVDGGGPAWPFDGPQSWARLYHAVLQALGQGGLLTGGAAPPGPDGAAAAEDRDAILRRFPGAEATLALIDDCAAALPDVLAGRRRGLDVLFPKGSHERMAAIYAGDPRVRHFNTLTARAADAFVTARLSASDAPLRILEIGAGTGGTSDLVLRTLRDRAERLTYDFTDISPALVHQARQRWAWAQPWTRFDVLDITEPPPAGRRYDLVIATNVLHATPDIQRTTNHVARLLAAGGVLLLNEATRVLDSVTLIFGLTEGWWLAEDQHLRLPHSPLLSPAGWSAVLATAGLQGVRHHAVNGWPDERTAQHLIVAEQGRWRHHADQSVAPDSTTAAEDRPGAPAAPGAGGARDEILGELTRICADVLRVPEEDLETGADLSTYGADSLLLMELLERLERTFGPLPAHTTQGSLDAIAGRLLSAQPADSPVGTPDAVAGHRSTPPMPPASAAGPEAPVDPPAHADEPIAIIGLAGRYPGASGLDGFWTALRAGATMITDVPPGRSPDLRGFHRWGAYLTDVDLFDPLLFRISPVEAHRMEPAERQLLQVAWEALEDAGYPPTGDGGGGRRLGTDVGVFVGAMHTQYEQLASHDAARPGGAVLSARWSLPNRMSQCFGLRGPSIAVDTACSSALTAIHLAVRSLRDGECAAALAGAANVILHPSHDEALNRGGILSPDGRPRVFDAEANGMITGEAVGVVLLKRLSDAVRDGDRVHGCVVATRLNADGGATGYAVPDADAEATLITEALRQAGLNSGSIDYVEAHATGSAIGDPVELAALRRAFTDLPPIGSLKAVIGHAEAASGMAQLTKVLLQMRHATIVGTPATDRPHPGVPLVREAVPWPARPGVPRRAMINSFGAGGANAHLIVEEPPPAPEPAAPAPTGHVLPLSARKPEQLRQLAARLRDFLRGPGAEVPLTAVAWTLQAGRAALKARAVWLVRDHEDAVRVLDDFVTSADGVPQPTTAGDTTAGSLADAWQSGTTVDWTVLHAPSDRHIVSLPHYPFARDSYWLPHIEPSPTTEERPLMTSAPAGDDPVDTPAAPSPSEITAVIADVIGVRPADIDDDDRLSDLGFDSVTMVTLATRLSRLKGAEMNPAVLYGFPHVAALVDAVRGATPDTSVAPTPPVTPVSPTPPVTPVPSTPPVATTPERHRTPRPSTGEGIAIIGLAGAFPGSPDLDTFWDHLVSGDDLITEPPPGRFTGQDKAGATRWGGFLDDIDAFDADFFRISPREAGLMDPHHRLFLQTAWSAIEEAGYDPTSMAGSACGVFVGVASSEYAQLARRAATTVDGQLVTGNDHSMVANRLSFLLDLRGPSEPVDTACSSSLVAVHRAVQALHSGDCEAAVVGGVNVILTPDVFDAFGNSGMLAPDGRCKSFDARADGYVRGEGVGALVLKPLSRALADGDHVHAVIAGTAVNHGGHATSLTAPNPAAQADVLVRAWERAGITPDDLSYVEAHGTGTALGDPIEIEGLKAAFARGSGASRQQCGLGSVKSNIGHLETAAGVAGVIKVVLSLRHRILPPTLHLVEVNPLVKLRSSPFHLVTSTRSWDARTGAGESRPRAAGVSSFGYGGANAHVALTEAAPRPAIQAGTPAGPQLFVLSAQDDERLRAYARRLLSFLQRYEAGGRLHELPPADVAHTLRVGRPALAARLAVVGDSLGHLADALRAFVDGVPDKAVLTSRANGGPDLTPEVLDHLTDRARAGALAPLAQAWVDGADIAWAALHRVGQGNRVSLPTYPFRKTRHWLPATAAPAPAAPPARPAPPASLAEAPSTRPTVTVSSADAGPATVAVPDRQPAGSASADSGAVRRRVREAVAEGIGIPVDAVDPDRDFGSYGVDSIGALRIMQQIQSRYGDHIPMAAILEYNNVDLLSAHLAENFVLPDAPPAERLDQARPGPDTAAPAAELIAFGGTSDGTPAYCLFGDTGELSWLLHLREALAGAGPVFGIEAPGFGLGVVPDADIRGLAAGCADAIAASHRAGPCRIFGHGTAGYVAAETARILMDRGMEVAELHLIGTPEPEPAPATPPLVECVAAVADLLGAAWGRTAPLTDLPPADAGVDAVVDAAADDLRADAPMEAPALRTWLAETARWYLALATAARAYRPWPISGAGTVTVVRPAQRTGSTQDGDFDRWVAPPPVIHDLDLPARALVSAEGARHLAPLIAGPAVAAPKPSAIVPINRYGVGPLSIWAHNLYGEVSYAVYLSRHLGPNRPLVGLEQVSGDAVAQEFRSVREMAGRYTAELREQHGGEPFVLGGCSFGGVLAYEIARQLQLLGEQVSRLIVIDPIMPATATWDSVDWSHVTDAEAESFSIVMLGNASCQRWGVAERVTLQDLAGRTIDEQLDVVARHIVSRSPARPDATAIRRQIRLRHDLMMRNNVILQEYRPDALIDPVPTTLFHATRGFLAAENDNDLPAIPRSNADPSNGFAEYVGDQVVIHDLDADHFTIAYDHNLTRIAQMIAPLLDASVSQAGSGNR